MKIKNNRVKKRDCNNYNNKKIMISMHLFNTKKDMALYGT